ncbi:pentatricopeptide repeat protein [Pochonia chlamydosporia 170]|uniref:Pentatricopeptide repeat protein n=1 Tax=Pochonia chlamydosporia 170 TaxID=1380566 RepID=A0A179G5J9_METCM|nr:pentatricopeptide repeat protein [Pochonia chlamydosporia 170]OAQ72758.1 pentatricopeptide repeat protein [Pochonia chlamydosporia 170]
MPCRPLLFDLPSRNGPICRTCLLAIRQKVVPPRIAAYSSQATSKSRTNERSRNTGSISRRPNKTELNQYLQGIKDLQANAKGDQDNGVFSVRFFEQDEHRRNELPDNEAFSHSVGKLDGSELKEALRDIQASLGSREEIDAFQAVLREVGGDVGNVGSAKDLEKMMERMEAYTKSIDAEIEHAGSNLPREMLDELQRDLADLPLSDEGLQPRIALPQIPEKQWTPNQRKKINRLNVVLSRAFRESRRSSGLTKNSVSAVYKAYHAARLTLARGWGHVPIEVWDLLWTVLSADESINIHRLAHVSLLARDMSEARVTLSPSQQLVTIEAVFVDGWEAKAIDNWKRCVSTLGDEKAETFKDYWELGVRIFCRVGDLDQAERAANKLLQRHMDPRILMPLVRTLSEQATTESQERAWTTYRKMRDLLGKTMKLSDYDQVISYFLATNQTENALYAFVDMMSDGEIDLKKQKYMPSVVANKFFLGKWLKRLIGAGDLHGAFNVVEFMRERGVAASPIHLNGLIGAWQRSGGTEDLERADKLAWDMIESRIRFVKSRAVGSSAEPESTVSWPRATLETFSLMAENYRLRELHTRMESLWDAFHESEISPDAFMMNQLLESHLQAGQPKDALDLYRSLVTERGISPDPYTFSALWKTLPVNRLHTIAPSSLPAEITTTRQLFCETASFRAVFEPDGIDGQLARKILHTFRRLKDDAGFLVALTALKQVFKFLPPETLVMELLLGTTKISWESPSQRKRLIFAKRTLDNELSAWADGDMDKLQGDRRGDALYKYLQRKFWLQGADEQRREGLMNAAREMGVYDVLANKM